MPQLAVGQLLKSIMNKGDASPGNLAQLSKLLESILIAQSEQAAEKAKDSLLTSCRAWGHSQAKEGRPLLPALTSFVSLACSGLGRSLSTKQDAPRSSEIVSRYSSILSQALGTLYTGYIEGKEQLEERPSKEPGNGLLLKGQMIDAAEAEKRRVARELHDGIGQWLTTAIFSLDILAANMPSSSEQMKESLQQVRANLLECTESLRALTFELRPPMLEDLGLIPTLRWFFRHSRLQEKVDLDWKVIGIEKRLPQDIETALFRIIQEATNNIMKHSQATRVEVRLEAVQDWVSLIISDNGIGFDPQVVLARNDSTRFSTGFRGMRERTEVLHGQFEVQSEPGSGTRIFVFLPLRGR